MTDETAPERIWAKQGMPGYVTDGPIGDVYDVEYIRKDLSDASIKALESENERLRHALTKMLGRYELYCGGPDALSVGITDADVMDMAKAVLAGYGGDEDQ